MKKQLQIAITVDPEIPVPPIHYGGIERIVAMLVDGLVRRGHKIHLFAHPDSKTSAKLILYKGQKSSSLLNTIENSLQVRSYIKAHRAIDIVHSFSRLAYLSFLMKRPIPKIQSYQRHVTSRSVRIASVLGKGSFWLTACSRYCANTADSLHTHWAIIPNGVEIKKYSFNPTAASDAPLVFLGRLEKIKGAHRAIEVAKKAGRKLIIAGNHASSGKDYDYFTSEILPYCDKKAVEYIGSVDDSQKNEILGKAAALLFPVEWDEPFGIVMAEALACGTPVIALNRGAVAEVVEDRKTGFICDTNDDMIKAVSRISSIERPECRRQAERRFSDRVIVEQYEQLYYKCIEEAKSI